MKIIYKNENDTAEFDKERWLNSLRSYGAIKEDEVDEVIKTKIECYQVPHVSVLVREGVGLFENDEDARRYYEEHRNGGEVFERLRRIGE